MTKLKNLIDSTLKPEAKQKLKNFGPDNMILLLEDILAMGRVAEAMTYICQHHPQVFQEAYKEVLKNDNR
tara:strand:+ start:267 stop:476 length:210 start_codon:yes stop_codon:yes gene_type:complete